MSKIDQSIRFILSFWHLLANVIEEILRGGEQVEQEVSSFILLMGGERRCRGLCIDNFGDRLAMDLQGCVVRQSSRRALQSNPGEISAVITTRTIVEPTRTALQQISASSVTSE